MYSRAKCPGIWRGSRGWLGYHVLWIIHIGLRATMDAHKGLLALVAAFFVVLLCACSASTPESDNGFPMSDMSGYTGLEDYDGELQFYDLTVKDIERLMEDGESFAFIAAFSNCPWCNMCIAQLNDAALAEDMQVGYLDTRLNPKWESNIDIDDYDTFVRLFGDYLRDDDQGIRHLYTPHVFFIKDGQVVAEHSSIVKGANDPTKPLTEEQSQELVALYRDGFAKTKEP